MYEKALKIDDKIYDIYHSYGIIYYEKKEYYKAIEMFNKAYDFNAIDSYIYFSIGLALYNQNKFKEAMEYYKNSIQINSDNLDHLAHMLRWIGSSNMCLNVQK